MKSFALTKKELWELVRKGTFQIRPFIHIKTDIEYYVRRPTVIKKYTEVFFKRYMNGKVLMPDFLVPNEEYFECWWNKKTRKDRELLENRGLLEYDSEVYLNKWPKMFSNEQIDDLNLEYENKSPQSFYQKE